MDLKCSLQKAGYFSSNYVNSGSNNVLSPERH